MNGITLAAALLPVLTGSPAPAQTEKKTKMLWLVFLETGKPAPKDPAVTAKLMEGHLGNFKKEWKDGRLLLAGPMKDPKGVKRGIVVLNAMPRKEVDEVFKADPYIQGGYLKVNAIQWDADKSRVSPKVDPDEMAEFTILLLKRPELQPAHTIEALQKAFADHRENMAAIKYRGLSGISGRLRGHDEFTGFMVFHGNDHEAVHRWMSIDGAVSGGFLEYDVYKLWMSKGVLKTGPTKN
jgi:uncharacterized protein YciI